MKKLKELFFPTFKSSQHIHSKFGFSVGDLVVFSTDLSYQHHVNMDSIWFISIAGSNQTYLPYEQIDPTRTYVIEELGNEETPNSFKLRFMDKDDNFCLITCFYNLSLERYLFSCLIYKLEGGMKT